MLSTVFGLSTAAPTIETYGTYNEMNYTQIVGYLGGGGYVIYMPEDWNGRLIIGCPGYNFFNNPNHEFFFDQIAKLLVSMGYAYAASDYNGGERAWLTAEGSIRTHQLTEYVVENYHVTDKIFLIGGSMGSQIALYLGQKYPMLYNGVLDLCGSKGTLNQWQYSMLWATKTVPEIKAALGLSFLPNEAAAQLKAFFIQVTTDIISANGGTREERPNAYEKLDASLHADISIPVISVVGGADLIVPLSVHLEYKSAVADAGHSDLYRQYIVPTGTHLDATVISTVPSRLAELIAWSDSLD